MNRKTHDDLPRLGFGMIRVAMNARTRVHENAERFLERDAVLSEVGDSLRGIPLEYDPAHMLPRQAYHVGASLYPEGGLTVSGLPEYPIKAATVAK